MARKSMRLSDCTNTIFTRSTLGVDNNSTLGSWNIENETILSQNSDISLKKIVGQKSFLEKVKQSFNASEISAAFPRGSLNNEQLKKKKRCSTSMLDTIKSPIKSSFSITESLPSPVKNLPERKCDVDISSSKSASDYLSNGLDSGTFSLTEKEIRKKRVSVNVRSDSTTLSNQTVKDPGKEMSNALEENSNTYSKNACNESAFSENSLTNSRRSSRRLRGKPTNWNCLNIQNENPVNHNMSLRNSTGEKISIKEDSTSNEQLVSIKKEEDSNGFVEINKSQTERTNLSQNQHSHRDSVLGFSQQSVLNSSQINTVDVGQNTGIDHIRDTSTRQLANNSTYTIETHNSIIKDAIDEHNILLNISCHSSTHFDKPSNGNSLSSIQSVAEPLLPLPSFHNKNDLIESNSAILKTGEEGINTGDEARNNINDSIQTYRSQENTHSLQISESANIEKKKKSSKSISGTDLEPHKDDIDLQKSTSYSINKSIPQKENYHEIKNNKTVIETIPLNGICESSICFNQGKDTSSGITPSKNKSLPIENPKQLPSKCNVEISNVDMDTGSQSNILNAGVQLGNSEINAIEDIINSKLMKSNGEAHNIKLRRSLRRSVTFANTVRFKSDSQSGEISISASPAVPNNPCSNEKNKEPQNPVNPEHSSPANNVDSGQQIVLKSPHAEKEIIEHTNCNKENQDNYICPEKKSINGKRVIELNETSEKRMCTAERTPLKNKRPSEKTINELSYDTYSDVSEIPLEKTLLQKKLIYHSTPKYSVLEKHASSDRSIRRSFRLQKNCKDQVIQVSKSIFGTSSEVTSGRKTSKELSTSYSFQHKVVQPKGKSLSAKNDTVKTYDQQCNSSCLSTSSSPLSPTISRKYYSSSDGNKASNEDSSANKCIPNFTSTVTNSLANSLQYQTKKTVCFKDFSSHIEYTNQKSTQGSSNFKTSESSLYTPTVTFSVTENYSINNASSSPKNDDSGSHFRSQSSKHSLSLSQVPHDLVSSKPVSELSIATQDLMSILIHENQLKKSIQHIQLDDSLAFINNNRKLKRRYDYESDERFMIGCRSYKPLSIKFPAKWVHPDLLKFICTKLNKNYDILESKVIGQKIITLLCATVSAVDRLENQNDIEASVLLLKNLICKYEICVNVMDYCMFIYRFTPYSFRRKMFSKKGKLFHSKAGSPIINVSEKIPIQ